MEFKIMNVTEKYRTLEQHNNKELKHDLEIPEDIRDKAFGLEKEWKKLVIEARKTDRKLTEVKKNFATQTQANVAKFLQEIKQYYADY